MGTEVQATPPPPVPPPEDLDVAAGRVPYDSIQPGGGFCKAIELAWGRLRRAYLRTFWPGYVRHMASRRMGDCPGCTHDIVDPRDLKYFCNVCGYWFQPEDDSFRWRNHLGLARVGLCEALLSSLVMLSLIGLLSALLSGWFYWILFLMLAAVWAQLIAFFRDPERKITADSAWLVSPADGTVVDVGEVEEPDFPGGRALRIGIFLSIFDVHVNRAPRTGKVVRLKYIRGKFLNALRPESKRENEQLWIDFQEPESGRLVRVKQISGLIARRIVCWLKPGDELDKGDRIGMIKFGSRTEVYVPVEAGIDVAVKIGDKVKGGASELLRYGAVPQGVRTNV